VPRRAALIAGIGGLGAALAAVVGAPAVAFVVHPLRTPTTRGAAEPLAIGRLEDFPDGVPVKVDLYADKVDAWNRVDDVKVGSAWVIRRGEALTAFSTVCPHLGCSVDYEAATGKFKCPCHRSAFGLDGAVEEGPSPRALDALETTVEAGDVRLTYVRFRQGTPAKEPIA
jgi:Rieske Fe-S protein